MRSDKFTTKAAEAIEAARAIVSQYHHGQIEPEHLLLALLQQSDGVVPQIVQTIGARPDALAAETERALQNKPQVFGGAATVGACRLVSIASPSAQRIVSVGCSTSLT